MAKSFEELRQLKNYYYNRAQEERHRADPWNWLPCKNPELARMYEKKSDKCLYEMLIMKGIDPEIIFTKEDIKACINEEI